MRLYFRKMAGAKVKDAFRGSGIKSRKPGSLLQQRSSEEMLETFSPPSCKYCVPSLILGPRDVLGTKTNLLDLMELTF